jgi:hypothetical protein
MLDTAADHRVAMPTVSAAAALHRVRAINR